MGTAIQKQSLYNIRVDHLELLQMIEDNEGEITPEIENALALTQEQFQEKAISYGFVLKTFDDNTDLIDREIERLQTLKNRAQITKDTIKQKLAEAMLQFGIEKIKTPTLTLSFRKSESVEIENVYAIPKEFIEVKTTESVSKTKIKEAIKAGEHVNGARIVTKQNLQIK